MINYCKEIKEWYLILKKYRVNTGVVYYHVVFPSSGESRVGGRPIPPAVKMLLVILGHQSVKILVDSGVS